MKRNRRKVKEDGLIRSLLVCNVIAVLIDIGGKYCNRQVYFYLRFLGGFGWTASYSLFFYLFYVFTYFRNCTEMHCNYNCNE